MLVFLVLVMISFVYAQTCTDSDNGVSYYTKGQVVVSENETSLSYNDACVYKLEETNAEFYVNYFGELYNNIEKCSGDNCYVAEAFCENNAKKWTIKTCPNGCSNGVCLCPTTKCSDGTVYSQEKCSVKDNVCICPSCPATKPTATCNVPTCYGAKDTGRKDSDGCPIYECQATPICQPTKCNDGSVYECKIVNNICTCPTCPAVAVSKSVSFYISGAEGIKKTYFPSETLNLVIKGVEADGTPATSEEGFNIQFYIDEWPLVQGQGSKGDNAYYKEGYWYGSIAVPDKLASYRLQLFLYCSRDNSYCATNYGIKGAQVENTYYFSIVKGEEISEKVICGFKNSQQEQKCYTAYINDRAYCSGTGTCVANISGYKGEQITWKSSCGGYQYTTMDGNDEKVEFECKAGETTITEIKNKGFRYAYFQCYDGAESKSTDREACKSAEYWKKFAENFCQAHCNKKTEKCGINSFSIGNECYIEETINEGVTVQTPIPTTPATTTTTEPQPVKEELILVCRDSCPLDGKCYPFGYRKSGKYCSDEGRFIEQLKSDETCDNNFECSSNVCVSGKCVSSSLIDKIISWFKRLFGGE